MLKLLVISLCWFVAAAASYRKGTEYYVGNWTTGVNFTQWAENKTFYFGDRLIFTVSGGDSVVPVSESAYDNCLWNLPSIFPRPTETINITLVPIVGDNYYISPVQANCNAGEKLKITVQAPPEYHPKEYTVGDDQGWAPGVNYEQWTANKRFFAGDSFRFIFNASQHSLVEVWERGYELCNETDFFPVVGLATLQDDGRTVIKIVPLEGDHYYTSANSNDCQSGLKVKLEIHPQDEAFAPAPSPDELSRGTVAAQDTSSAMSSLALSTGSLLAIALLAMA